MLSAGGFSESDTLCFVFTTDKVQWVVKSHNAIIIHGFPVESFVRER